MDLFEAMELFEEQEKLHTNEGSRGVKNLCRLVHAIGYQDPMHLGQFHPKGNYGDLINFLEDNSGCIEAIKQWIGDSDIDDWKENLLSHCDETEDED